MLQAYRYFQKNNWHFELIQVAVNKVDTQAKVAMLKAQNPVFLFTAQKNTNDE
jgi:cobalt-precorrin-6B (C15)-methyltransferase